MANIDFNKRFEDKSLKFAVWTIVIVVLVILIVLSGVTANKIISGEHVKVFGLEYNIPKIQPDTVIKTVTKDNDSLNHKKPILSSKRLSMLPPRLTRPKIDNSKPQDTNKQTGKYVISAPVSQSAVGDGASVTNNNFAPPPRTFSKDESNVVVTKIDELLSQNKEFSKTTKVRFLLPVQDTEAFKYADQVSGFLNYRYGFANWEVRYAIFTGIRKSNFELVKSTDDGVNFIEVRIFSQNSILQ